MDWTSSAVDRGLLMCSASDLGDLLAPHAARIADPRAAAAVGLLRAPLRVAVTGRAGVGRDTVAVALADAGVSVIEDATSADLLVVVAAETVKPEDSASLRSAGIPAMVVLNKADLAGSDPDGPVAGARRHAAELARELGRPVVPMIALLAIPVIGGDEMAALGQLVATQADMTSVDAFVAAEHPLPAARRAQLLGALDRFGLAHALLAIADGADQPGVLQRLRELSQLDRVVDQLAGVAAPTRYQRIRAALRDLQTAAAVAGDDELAAVLVSDEVVIAVMAAAVDVVQAAGATVDRGDDADAHLRRAVRWQRYARGPVSVLHQRCATDISRGSLRLLYPRR